MARPVILTWMDYYLPGYLAGGPIPSVANLVNRLGDEFDFRIVTRDRDLGASTAYPQCPHRCWTQMGNAQVLYLPPRQLRLREVGRILRETPHDIRYLNSVFSKSFTIWPLLCRRASQSAPTIIAPRGELAASALSKSAARKRLYLAVARKAGLFRDVVWQASSEFESRDIRRVLGEDARVQIAPDMPPEFPRCRVDVHAAKSPNSLRVAFLSRLHPVKNLDFALQLLSKLSVPVRFSIFGPAEDPEHLRHCLELAAALPEHVEATYEGPLTPQEVPLRLRQYDALLLPTRGENFGHVILESLAAGTPVVISDQTPWRELRQAGVGWDLPLCRPAEFHKALRQLAAMDDEQHTAWRRRCQDYASRFCAAQDVLQANRRLFGSGATSVSRPESRSGDQDRRKIA